MVPGSVQIHNIQRHSPGVQQPRFRTCLEPCERPYPGGCPHSAPRERAVLGDERPVPTRQLGTPPARGTQWCHQGLQGHASQRQRVAR